MQAPADRRVKLFSDVVYLKTDQGVVLRNAEGSFTIAGKQAFQLVHWLASRLDGRPLEPLLAAQPAPLQTPLRQLADTLIERRFARALIEEGEQPPWQAEHAQQIDYLEHLVDRPLAAFARFRGTRALCIGEGVLRRNLEQALREYGLQQLIAVDALVETDALPPADIAFIAHDRRDADAAPAQRALRDLGVPFFELGRAAQYTFVHAGGAGAAPLCRQCLQATLKDAPRDVDWVAPAAAAMAAHHAAFHALRHLAAAQPLPPGLLLIEQPSLVSGMKPLPRAWECPHHGGWRLADPVAGGSAVPWRRDRPFAHDPTDEIATLEAINQCANRLTDPLLGPLHALDEDGLDQVPLGASRATVRGPGDRGPVQIVTHALTAREARNQAVLAALETGLAAASWPPEDWTIGAGWSEQEALLRAVRRHLDASCARLPAESFERCRLERHAAGSSTVAYLLETLVADTSALRSGLIALHGDIHLARLFDGDRWTGARGVGASPLQAVANLLLDAVASRDAAATPHTLQVPGLLFLDLSLDATGRFIDAVVSAFDVRRVVAPVPRDTAVQPVVLALRERSGSAQ